MHDFCHLHCHTEYSLLDGAAKVKNLLSACKTLGMKSLAITDHGNMFGVPHFVAEAKAQQIKPIVGCEFYLAEDRLNFKDKTRYHQLLLAKNKVGYQNMIKLSSLAFTEGYYYKPRIDKALLSQYKEGLIATTGCLNGPVPKAIINYGEDVAEKLFVSWLELFGDDYYIELQRHDIEEQDICNGVLLKWSKKYNVPAIATNDVHYIWKQDHVAQDVLLCLQTGKDYRDPHRMRFKNNQFFLKSPEDMAAAFVDVPQALANTLAVEEKIEVLNLERDILLPTYSIPSEFQDANAYLYHLAFQGAKAKFGTLSPQIEEQLQRELDVISHTGFAGYFLVVRDLIDAAKKLNVVVGPGRGSVVGSLAAFCLGITKINPLQYHLLFERFLNPERISMPDIDIDFDDEGRKKIIDYVVEKYGKTHVASVITFGSMAAKSAVRDVARVFNVPLARANYLAKLIPDKLGVTLAEAFQEVEELAQIREDDHNQEGEVLRLAETLEGAVRHTGIHAAGIIIAPDDITNYVPVKIDKNTNLLVTQYEGSVLEQVGMLKMDILGLKTLSIIRDACRLVEQNRGIKVDIDNLPLDDPLTFELYQRGNTRGTFQFESDGMRQWLVKLKPENIEELVAMNALYRPGPMQFIPSFIARKHGIESIDYPHPLLEPILEHTYGIMIYQEQIMQTARVLAGYSLGQADLLRRAMGKKKAKEMAEQRDVFINRAAQVNHIAHDDALHIFDIMEKFAQYGFNRSHAAAYTLLAYQTAYLKAHYTAEYMAALLTHHQGDLSKISFFIDETKQQGIQILAPDINKSGLNFSVDDRDSIRFGLGSIKGVGYAVVEQIIAARERKGCFKDIYDFMESLPNKAIHKKTLECLALSGALDCFANYHRKQYVCPSNGVSFIEKLMQYAASIKKEKKEKLQNLFGDEGDHIRRPIASECRPYTYLEQLALEKSLVGFYITGHPLDEFAWDIEQLCNVDIQNLSTVTDRDKPLKLAGVLVECTKKYNKNGQAFAVLTLEDKSGSENITIWSNFYKQYEELLVVGNVLLISGHMDVRPRSSVVEFKVQAIYLLEDIRKNMVEAVQLNLVAEDITEDLIEQLELCFKNNPGTSLVKFAIQDQQEQNKVELVSGQYRVALSNALLMLLSKEQIAFDVHLTKSIE